MKKVLKGIGLLLGIVLVVLIGYVIYVFASNSRIEDKIPAEVEHKSAQTVEAQEEIRILSWNIGFGAYEQDYGFFMDGGNESWARSEAGLKENLQKMADLIQAQQPDIALIQEIDCGGTRTYNVDEVPVFVNRFPEYDTVFVHNWHSPFLFFPFDHPQGFIRGGILTLSRYGVKDAIRRSLPVEKGITSIVDMDRCYSVSELDVANGKKLYLYNMHLSAYTTDGKIADEQMKMLAEDMAEKVREGHYAIAGGDFNKDLTGDSSKYFGVSTAGYSWAQPVRTDILDANGILLQVPLDPDHPVPTCRNADGPYTSEQMVITVDGFLVSNNVQVEKTEVIDTRFMHSDHNPVMMTVTLIP